MKLKLTKDKAPRAQLFLIHETKTEHVGAGVLEGGVVTMDFTDDEGAVFEVFLTEALARDLHQKLSIVTLTEAQDQQ